MTGDRITQLVEELAGSLSETTLPFQTRECALDQCLATASTRLLQAVASLSVARLSLRTGNAEGGMNAIHKYQEHLMAALHAVKAGGDLYASPQSGIVH